MHGQNHIKDTFILRDNIVKIRSRNWI